MRGAFWRLRSCCCAVRRASACRFVGVDAAAQAQQQPADCLGAVRGQQAASPTPSCWRWSTSASRGTFTRAGVDSRRREHPPGLCRRRLHRRLGDAARRAGRRRPRPRDLRGQRRRPRRASPRSTSPATSTSTRARSRASSRPSETNILSWLFRDDVYTEQKLARSTRS